MADEHGTQSGQSSASAESGAQDTNDVERFRSENDRLRGENTRLKQLNQKAVPWVQVALKLNETPEGQAIIQRIVEGKPLTEGQEGKVKDAQTKTASEEGLTEEKVGQIIEEKLSKVMDSVDAKSAAREAVRELDQWAAKELPGYNNIKRSDLWNRAFASVEALVQNGVYVVPESEENPYQWMVRKTYNLIKEDNPDMLKTERKAPKSEAERAAEILAAGRKPSASSSQDELDKLPEKERREIEWIRSIGSSRKKF